MLEIEDLLKIKLQTLKPFFKKMGEIRGNFLETIKADPEKEEQLLSGIIRATLQSRITLSNCYGSTAFNIEAVIGVSGDSVGIEKFIFKWEDRGEKRSEAVRIASRPSNLINGALCYYFVCPYTGKLCRNLYTDGRVLISRFGFTHTYSQRNMSKSSRNLIRAVEAMAETDKEQRYRKEYYRGKLTPYGRRIRKLFSIMVTYIGDPVNGLENALIAPSRGRPPKLW